MKTTKKQLKEIAKLEKKVAEVCGTEKGKVAFDEVTGIPYVESEIKPKKTTEVTLNDKGVIINKETGEPHFGAIDIDKMKKLVKEKKSRKIEIALSFKQDSASLKFQLNKQGFELHDSFLHRAEEFKFNLHSLNQVGILTDKQLLKCFKRFYKEICKKIIISQLKEGEKAKHIKTIINK